MEKKEMGKCYFCGKEVDNEFYCYGCEHYICEEHLGCDAPMGKHDVEEHRKCWD